MILVHQCLCYTDSLFGDLIFGILQLFDVMTVLFMVKSCYYLLLTELFPFFTR